MSTQVKNGYMLLFLLIRFKNFLKLRGVLIAWQRKLDLVSSCQAAHEISI